MRLINLVMDNRIVSIAILAFLILFSTAIVGIRPVQLISAQTQNATTNNATSSMSTVKVSGNSSVSPIGPPSKSAESSEPIILNPQQLKALEEQVNETFGGYPKGIAREAVPVQPKGPEPNTATIPSTAPPSLDVNGSNISMLSNMSTTTNANNTTGNSSKGTTTSQNTSMQAFTLPVRIYKSTLVSPVDPRSIIGEPSLANKGPIVFVTGNWYAARSTDFGATWKYVNPFTMSDFCCDQDVIYDKNHGIFLWYRQGIASSTTGENRFMLGVSKDALTWVFYSITPTLFNSAWTNQWFDYPHIALSNNHLWITSNMFNKAGQFVRTVISSWPLSPLSLGQTVNFQYFFETQEFNFTPVQGSTTDTMYFAVHHSNAQMKLYRWTAGDGISFRLVNIPVWNFGFRGNMVCSSPDSLNWCARSDSRITGGWVSNGIIGFLWNARQGSGFAYPYVNVAIFRETDFSFLSNPKLWNSNFAFMFGYASPNNIPGELGIVAMYGGGFYYPSIAAGIVDGASGTPPPYQLVTIRAGNHAATGYGDYMRDRPFNDIGRFWIGSGYTLQGCTSGNCVESRFYAFGR